MKSDAAKNKWGRKDGDKQTIKANQQAKPPQVTTETRREDKCGYAIPSPWHHHHITITVNPIPGALISSSGGGVVGWMMEDGG
jgi:hypothetical protein